MKSTALAAFRRRRLLDAALLAEYDGHQGPDHSAQSGVCQLPRPRQQRHCRGYEVDTGALGDDTGRCLHKAGACRCRWTGQEANDA